MEAGGRPTGGTTTTTGGPVSLYLERSSGRLGTERKLRCLDEMEVHGSNLGGWKPSRFDRFGTPGTLDAWTPRATHMPARPGLLRPRTRPGSPANVNHLPAPTPTVAFLHDRSSPHVLRPSIPSCCWGARVHVLVLQPDCS